MSFTFNTTIPAAGNNPSNDQPIMLTNNVSNAAIWAVDHIGFNANNGGTHQTLTFISNPSYVVPGASTGNQSVVYVNAGVAATFPQVYFQTSQATYPMSLIRAYGQYPGTSVNGPVVANNQYNISSVSRISMGIYAVTLTANVVTGSIFGILATFQPPVTNRGIVTYAITGTGTFNLTFLTLSPSGTASLSDPISFTFQVLQI